MKFSDLITIKLDKIPDTNDNPVSGSIYLWTTIDTSNNLVINYKLHDGTTSILSGGTGSGITSIAVDGTTITGAGTVGDPLVSHATGSGSGSPTPITLTPDESGNVEINFNAGTEFILIPASAVNITTSNAGDFKEALIRIENGFSLVHFPTNWNWIIDSDYSLSSVFSYDDYSYHYTLNRTSTIPPVLVPSGINLIKLTCSTMGTNTIINARMQSVNADPNRNDLAVKLLLNFNETDGAFVDSSASAKTVTNYNVTCDTTDKVFGAGSAVFNGTNAYLEIPASTDWNFEGQDYTIDMWMKNIGLPGNHSVPLGLNGDVPWSICISPDGTVRGYVHPSFYYTTADFTTDGNWHHFAMVKYGTELKIYKDGVCVFTSVTPPDLTSTDVLRIGKNNNAGDWFNGKIDCLRISKGIARWTKNFDDNLPTEY